MAALVPLKKTGLTNNNSIALHYMNIQLIIHRGVMYIPHFTSIQKQFISIHLCALKSQRIAVYLSKNKWRTI